MSHSFLASCYNPTALTDLSILEPRDENSKVRAYWELGLNNLLDEGWRLCYTDGLGVAAGVFSEDRKGNPTRTYGAFGGTPRPVAGGEILAVAVALEEEEPDMIALVSESQAAIQYGPQPQQRALDPTSSAASRQHWNPQQGT